MVTFLSNLDAWDNGLSRMTESLLYFQDKERDQPELKVMLSNMV